MKTCIRSIAIVNGTLCVLCLWVIWMGHSHLPGQLSAGNSSEVMLEQYQNVCARLTASMAGMCFLAMVVIDVALIYMYSVLKKSLPSALETDSDKS